VPANSNLSGLIKVRQQMVLFISGFPQPSAIDGGSVPETMCSLVMRDFVFSLAKAYVRSANRRDIAVVFLGQTRVGLTRCSASTASAAVKRTGIVKQTRPCMAHPINQCDRLENGLDSGRSRKPLPGSLHYFAAFSVTTSPTSATPAINAPAPHVYSVALSRRVFL
jgi:hypothetical protein